MKKFIEEVISEIETNRPHLRIINKFQTNTYIFNNNELGLIKLELIRGEDGKNYCNIYVNGILEGTGGIKRNCGHFFNPVEDAVCNIKDIDIKNNLKKSFRFPNLKTMRFPKKYKNEK